MFEIDAKKVDLLYKFYLSKASKPSILNYIVLLVLANKFNYNQIKIIEWNNKSMHAFQAKWHFNN